MAEKTENDGPPIGGKPDWCRRLRDVRGCRREIARVYGRAHAGSMDWADASKAANILFFLAKLHETSSIEERISALEAADAAADAAGPPPRGPNGRHRPSYRQ